MLRDVSTVDVFRLVVVEEGLESGKDLQRFTVDDLCARVKEVLCISEKTSHQGYLLANFPTLSKGLSDLLNEDLNESDSLAISFLKQGEKKKLVKRELARRFFGSS